MNEAMISRCLRFLLDVFLMTISRTLLVDESSSLSLMTIWKKLQLSESQKKI
jgi:hypothetical protein